VNFTDKFAQYLERKNRAIGNQRIGDLNKFFAYRYGGNREDYIFPDDDAGIEDLKILLQHYALNNPLAMPRIIKLRAPYMGHNRAVSLLEEIYAYPRKWRADTLGRLLGFTGAEWKILRLRTIAPIDMTRAERVAYSQILAAQRKKAKRRAKGAKPREQSLSRLKPWAAEGTSRRTWERRMAKNPGDASLSTIKLSLKAVDAFASRSKPQGREVKWWPSGEVSTKPRRPTCKQSQADYYQSDAPSGANACIAQVASFPWIDVATGGAKL
jgi:hypothetical protein